MFSIRRTLELIFFSLCSKNNCAVNLLCSHTSLNISCKSHDFFHICGRVLSTSFTIIGIAIRKLHILIIYDGTLSHVHRFVRIKCSYDFQNRFLARIESRKLILCFGYKRRYFDIVIRYNHYRNIQ